MAVHLTSLCDEVGRELTVADPEDGVEDEDLASPERTLELINEMIVPRNGLCLALSLAPVRLGGIGVAGDNHHSQSLVSVVDNVTLRWSVDKRLATEVQSDDSNV